MDVMAALKSPTWAKTPVTRRSLVNAAALVYILQLCVQANGDCELPKRWHGRWFHSGFPQLVHIDSRNISVKGECVEQRAKNMFLMRVSESSYGSCYRCMTIFEKHFNVLQYKESYCDEEIHSMEDLCNSIAGDAKLYTMFRKGGAPVKCPFRGPHSFSYSHGGGPSGGGSRGSGICDSPLSFMDTCAEGNSKLKLRYQACIDVAGSEVANEELSCLATWKEGPSFYLVAELNSSRVYTDEARYRCFLYQRQRPFSPGHVVYKMAQSEKASCVGLWSVDEGVKTFEIKKLEKSGKQCRFPVWLARHHEWRSLDAFSLHVNKRRHSLKLSNQTAPAAAVGRDNRLAEAGAGDSHATCHQVEQEGPLQSRIVAHVKAGCDSGYVCMVFHGRDKHVIQLRYGGKSRHPSEACSHIFFDERNSPMVTLVAAATAHGQNTRPCPFSGRYSLSGPPAALNGLLRTNSPFQECETISAVMQAGCSSGSSGLQIESRCVKEKSGAAGAFTGRRGDASATKMMTTLTDFACHGQWSEGEDWYEEQQGHPAADRVEEFVFNSGSGGRAAALTPSARPPQSPPPSSQTRRGRSSHRTLLILSAGPALLADNSVARRYFCLAYTEQDGILQARVSANSCSSIAASFSSTPSSSSLEQFRFDQRMGRQSRTSSAVNSNHHHHHHNSFNISSSGPCLQALTGGAARHHLYLLNHPLLLLLSSLLTVARQM